jgi:hypothetical protein
MLHLEFKKLKGFVESEQPRRRIVTARPQFVELMASAAGFPECDVELEGRHGKMRIHWKGMTAADLAEFSRMILGQT